MRSRTVARPSHRSRRPCICEACRAGKALCNPSGTQRRMIALRHARCIARRVARHPVCNFVHAARCKSSKPRPHSQPGFPSIARSACDIHSMHTIIAEKMQCAQQSRKQLLTLRPNPPTCSGPQRSSSAYGTRLCRLSMPGARRLRPCGSPSSLLLHGHARRQTVRCAGARNTRRRRKAMWRGTFGRIDIVHHEDLAIFRRMTYVCSQVVRACGDTAAEQLSRVTWRVDRFFRHKIVTVALP